MVKFILAIISIILIGLVYYTYTDETDIKRVVTENEVSLSEKKPIETKALKIPKKETEVTKKEVKQPAKVKVDDSFVLEDDTNGDEKDIMDKTILSNMNNSPERQPLPNKEEMLKLIIDDSLESAN